MRRKHMAKGKYDLIPNRNACNVCEYWKGLTQFFVCYLICVSFIRAFLKGGQHLKRKHYRAFRFTIQQSESKVI